MTRWRVVAFILMLAAAGHGLVVSEVMYDPVENDAYNEWIELASNETVDLANWTLCGDALAAGYINRNGTLVNATSTVLPANGYALITDGGSGTEVYDNFSVVNATALHVSASTMCGGLSNTGETITLGNATFNVTFAYNASQGGANNNRTLCVVANETKECLPTPGAASAVANNDLSITLANTSLTISPAQLFNVTSSGCSIAAALAYNVTNSTYAFAANETLTGACSLAAGAWTPPAAGVFIACGTIAANDTNVSNNAGCANVTVSEPSCTIALGFETNAFDTATVHYNMTANDTQCANASRSVTIEYWIEDVFGAVAKEPTNTTHTMTCSLKITRQWTPNAFVGSEAFVLKARLAAGCPSSSNASKAIAVAGTKPESASSITIVSAPSSATFGESVNIELDIYRGATEKYAIDIRIENATNASEAVTVHAKNKFTTYSFKVPVLLRSNCDGALAAGTYTIRASGLGVIAARPIQINGTTGSMCKTITVSARDGSSGNVAAAKGSALVIDLLAFNDTVTENEPFTTNVRVTNNQTSAENVSVYSYIFDGNVLHSEGGWTANKKAIQLAAHASSDLALDTTPEGPAGLYQFRVRARTDTDYDLTRDIAIVAKPQKARDDSGIVKNTSTPTNPTGTAQRGAVPVTGRAPSRSFVLSRDTVVQYLIIVSHLGVLRPLSGTAGRI